MSKKKEPEPNYRMLCESCYESNKALMAKYQELEKKRMRMLGIGRKGFVTLAGYDEVARAMNRIMVEIQDNFTRYAEYEKLAEAQETQSS